MKKLMLTTALVAATSIGAVAQTQSTTTGGQTEMTQNGANVPAFLATDFTGKDLYTLDTDATRNLNETRMAEGQTAQERSRMRWQSGDAFAADRDSWDNVGNIDDMIMTQDGELRGVLLDVGGFLGIGARTVMVDLDDLYFVADDTNPDNIDDFFVVATMTRDQLENLPEWDESQLSVGFTERSFNGGGMQQQGGADQTQPGTADPMQAEGGDQMQPGTAEPMQAEGGDQMQQDGTDQMAGYDVMPADQMTADRILGANVYDVNGDNIANVDDLVLAADGEVTHAVMDVGGFLGMASHTVALAIEDLEIMWSEANQDVRVQVSMTQEELENMPEYEG